jgi:hypothetical protein
VVSIPTGRTPRRKEVENVSQHQCIATLPALVSPVRKVRSVDRRFVRSCAHPDGVLSAIVGKATDVTSVLTDLPHFIIIDLPNRIFCCPQ